MMCVMKLTGIIKIKKVVVFTGLYLLGPRIVFISLNIYQYFIHFVLVVLGSLKTRDST